MKKIIRLNRLSYVNFCLAGSLLGLSMLTFADLQSVNDRSLSEQTGQASYKIGVKTTFSGGLSVDKVQRTFNDDLMTVNSPEFKGISGSGAASKSGDLVANLLLELDNNPLGGSDGNKDLGDVSLKATLQSGINIQLSNTGDNFFTVKPENSGDAVNLLNNINLNMAVQKRGGGDGGPSAELLLGANTDNTVATHTDNPLLIIESGIKLLPNDRNGDDVGNSLELFGSCGDFSCISLNNISLSDGQENTQANYFDSKIVIELAAGSDSSWDFQIKFDGLTDDDLDVTIGNLSFGNNSFGELTMEGLKLENITTQIKLGSAISS